MKKVLIFLVVFNIATIGFASNLIEKRVSIKFVNDEASIYIEKFYGKNYSLGKSAIVTDENKLTLEVTEITIDGDNRARGYVATNKENGKFLYFVDIDRKNFEMTSFDVGANNTVKFKEINKNQNYESTNEFDLIYVLENNSDSSKRRFWGWSCGPEIEFPNGDCIQNCVHYIFWMENGQEVRSC